MKPEDICYQPGFLFIENKALVDEEIKVTTPEGTVYLLNCKQVFFGNIASYFLEGLFRVNRLDVKTKFDCNGMVLNLELQSFGVLYDQSSLLKFAILPTLL